MAKFRKSIQLILEVSFLILILLPSIVLLAPIKLMCETINVLTKYMFFSVLILMSLLNKISPKEKVKQKKEKTKFQLFLVNAFKPIAFLIEYLADEK